MSSRHAGLRVETMVAPMYLASPYYRIISPDGEHVATVKAEDVEGNLSLYNERRELDVDGAPIGEYRAEGYDGYVAGAR